MSKKNYRRDGDLFFRKDAIKTAKELGYGESVIKRLRHAKSEPEVQRILTDARHSETERSERIDKWLDSISK